MNGKIKALELLEKYGADFSLTGKRGFNVMHWAATNDLHLLENL